MVHTLLESAQKVFTLLVTHSIIPIHFYGILLIAQSYHTPHSVSTCILSTNIHTLAMYPERLETQLLLCVL